ncbi:MAG: ACP S-malonyltransferase [Tatlockia sp.]|nr:ACP S-malonyltransferase [Tatlockia sp.]
MTTCMFPGQGAQFKGMGADIFAYYPDELKIADKLLGFSIEELCISDPKHQLNQTQFTQPALYVVEALSFKLNYSAKNKPDYCIGHSLGEYSALYAAGAFDFITGLELVIKRGELMAQQSNGAMLAVLDLPAKTIQLMLLENDLDSIDFANFNSNKQIVLAGPAEDIKRAQQILSLKARKCIPLLVSAAFHSRYMTEAAACYEQFLKPYNFSKLHTTVIANATVQPFSDDTIKEFLVKQFTSSVHWDQVIAELKKKGETEFIEIGPSKVLTSLLKQN